MVFQSFKAAQIGDFVVKGSMLGEQILTIIQHINSGAVIVKIFSSHEKLEKYLQQGLTE